MLMGQIGDWANKIVTYDRALFFLFLGLLNELYHNRGSISISTHQQ